MPIKSFGCYLRRGIVYIPTFVRLETGVRRTVDPIAVVPVSHTDDLRRAFLETIARGNREIPAPKDDHFDIPILKYAGVKTWAAFARGTSTWDINEKDGVYQIGSYRKYPGGGWVPDLDQTVTLPQGSGAEDAVERMIAILQSAARQ